MKLAVFFVTVLAATVELVSAVKCPAGTKANIAEGELWNNMWDFATIFYYQKDLKAAANKYIAEDYIQHNDGLKDGRKAVIDGFGPLVADPKTAFTIRQLLLFDQHMLIQAEASFAGGPKMVVYDLYRLQGNCIVEHWDVMMEQKKKTVSNHPYF